MTLSELSVRRPVTFFMFFIAIVVVGVVCLARLSPELLPDFSFPIVGVITSYPDVGPQEIENLITRPIEGTIGTVTNVKEISSITREGSSIIIINFNWGSNMDVAALDVREKIDLIQRILPGDAERPMIFKFDPTMMPVMVLSVSSRDKDDAALRKLVDDKIKPLVERIDGVGYSNVRGGLEREIHVDLNRLQMEARGLTIDQVVGALRAASLNLSGGTVTSGNKEYTVRGVGQFKSIEEIEKVAIPSPRGTFYVRDIADVKDTFKEREMISLINGSPGIILVVQKASGHNTVKVCNSVKKELKSIEKTLPGIKTAVLMDQSAYIEKSINQITGSLLQGSILAVIVLFVFLFSFRTTGVIALAIPISVIGTFIFMSFTGISLNMMSMSGLALAVGMLVDNAIVVLENSYRRHEEGEDRITASINGSNEMFMPILGSTLTTIAVFLPMAFVTGIVGIFSKDMALTVTLSLIVSFFMAITLVPLLCSRVLKKSDPNKFGGKAQLWWVNVVLKKYEKYLGYCLGRRKTLIFSVLALFFVSLLFIYPLRLVGTQFMPKMDQGSIGVTVEMPIGTKLEETRIMVEGIEKIIRAKVPEISSFRSSVGSASGMAMAGAGGGAYQASIDIELVDLSKRKRSQWAIERVLRSSFKQIPGAKISFGGSGRPNMMMAGGSPVSVEIYGYDMDRSKEIAEQVKGIIRSIPGTADIEVSLKDVKPEVQLLVDRDKASSCGMAPASIINTMRSYIYGVTANRFRDSGEEYNVVVRLREKDRGSIDDLRAIPLSLPSGTARIGDVTSVRTALGPLEINRKLQERIVTVNADYEGKDLGRITNEIRGKVGKLVLPENFFIRMGGEAKELKDSFRLLMFALLGAILLVYAIMASTFESLMDPFIIMFTLPLAVIGVVFILFFTGTTLNIFSFVGIIMLAGIAVNNGIVMIDYIKNLRIQGLSISQAVIKGASTRLRPVLMTSLTTIFGLLPMSMGMGEGAEIQTPISRALLGGMTVATFLTLFFIPTLYSAIEEWLLARKQRRKDKGLKAQPTAANK